MVEARTPRSWRARLAAVTVAVGLIAGAASLAPAVAAPAAPAKAQPPKVAAIGKHAVGKVSETFVDGSRPTEANGDVPELPNRTILAAIYYPAKGKPTDVPVDNAPADTKHGPYPLILFSHGLYARGVFYEDILKTWASAGYVVAAPDYPLSNQDARGGVYFGKAVGDTKNQPADATFVINGVIKLDKQNKRFGGIDGKRIGASGHSLGGITTYGLAYSACCRDKRIKAALPMSGFGGLVEPIEKYVWDGEPPLLALHGNSDGTVPYVSDVNTLLWAKPPKFLVTFIGAGHVVPFLGGETAQAMALKQSTVDFLDRYLKDDKSALEKLRTHANVPGQVTLDDQSGTTGASTATTKPGSKGG
jgi:dienelactone hydrolase